MYYTCNVGCTQVVSMTIRPLPVEGQLLPMRDHVVGYILACGVAHRLNELFSLFDKPQVSNHTHWTAT